MNLNDVMGNDKKQQLKSPENEQNRFIQISSESIEVIANSVGYSDIEKPISTSLAEDSSYRLRELLQGCLQILHHSKKSKLTKDDVNLALHWSDVPQLHGQHPQLVDFLYLPEVDIFSQVDQSVDFTQDYRIDVDIEVYSCLKLNTILVSFEPDEKLQFEVYAQYFERILQSLLSTSDCILEVALKNLKENAKLQPLLPALAKFLQNLLGFGHENFGIIQRIPLIIHALKKNPYLFLMPEQETFVELLKNLLIVFNELELDKNIYNLISSTGHMLAKVCSDCDATHAVISELNEIISDPSRSIITQCRAIYALRCFNIKFLDLITVNTWNLLISKLESKKPEGTEPVFILHILVSAIVDVLRYRLACINRHLTTMDILSSFERALNEGSGLYSLAKDLLGSSVIFIGPFPPEYSRLLQEERKTNRCNERCREIYWTIKTVHKLPSTKKWDFSPKLQPANVHRTLPIADVRDVFDCSNKKVCATHMCFRVRNWNPRSVEELKRKVFPQNKSPTLNGRMLYSYVKVAAKNYLPKSSISFNFPVADYIL